MGCGFWEAWRPETPVWAAGLQAPRQHGLGTMGILDPVTSRHLWAAAFLRLLLTLDQNRGESLLSLAQNAFSLVLPAEAGQSPWGHDLPSPLVQTLGLALDLLTALLLAQWASCTAGAPGEREALSVGGPRDACSDGTTPPGTPRGWAWVVGEGHAGACPAFIPLLDCRGFCIRHLTCSRPRSPPPPCRPGTRSWPRSARGQPCRRREFQASPSSSRVPAVPPAVAVPGARHARQGDCRAHGADPRAGRGDPRRRIMGLWRGPGSSGPGLPAHHCARWGGRGARGEGGAPATPAALGSSRPGGDRDT